MTTTISVIPSTNLDVTVPSLDLDEVGLVSRQGSQAIYRLGTGLDTSMIPVLTMSHRSDPTKGSTRATMSVRIPIKESDSSGNVIERGNIVTTLTVDTPRVAAGLTEQEYATAILSVLSAVAHDLPGGSVVMDPGEFVAFFANGRTLK